LRLPVTPVHPSPWLGCTALPASEPEAPPRESHRIWLSGILPRLVAKHNVMPGKLGFVAAHERNAAKSRVLRQFLLKLLLTSGIDRPASVQEAFANALVPARAGSTRDAPAQ
jgi:hypothetical protein